MAAVYTIDASVFINAFNPFERGHAESRRVVSAIRDRGLPIVVPTLVLPEVAATIARGRNDPVLARQFAGAIGRLPHVTLVPLDSVVADSAIDVAAEHRLRGSDSVYAAVALRFSSVLVTLDREQYERLASVLPARYPGELLFEIESG